MREGLSLVSDILVDVDIVSSGKNLNIKVNSVSCKSSNAERKPINDVWVLIGLRQL